MINRFEGLHQFLSNFYSIPITYDGMSFLSVGHAYAAAKTTNHNERVHVVHLGTAREVLNYAQKLPAREGWEGMRLDVMEELLRQKFSYPAMRTKLDQTIDHELVYGNSPDTFWGINEMTGHGENHLGKLLMKIRNEL